MKSSSGAYYIGLDHIRALAVFVVWAWHFIQIHESPEVAIFPVTLLAEGHMGVSIFMVLSGYLFARLMTGKRIDYRAFLTSRFFRLAPLLFFVLAIVAVKHLAQGDDIAAYLTGVAQGIVLPTLPNGGWSITVEMQFYLLLPFLLFLQGRWKFALLGVLLTAILFRIALSQHITDMHDLSFFTIVGRIDQFLLGMLACQFRAHLKGRHGVMAIATAAFAAFYVTFDSVGGYYTEVHAFWVYVPTVEGLMFAIAVAWYDTSFEHSTGPLSRFVASIGTYSYSIYLLHFFVVWEVSTLIHEHVVDLSNIYVGLLFAILVFPLAYLIGLLGYRVIELPFLAKRRGYTLPDNATGSRVSNITVST